MNDVVRDVRDAGGAAMIVLHDRHSAGDMIDRVVRLGQGLVIEDRSLDVGSRDANEQSAAAFVNWSPA